MEGGDYAVLTKWGIRRIAGRIPRASFTTCSGLLASVTDSCEGLTKGTDAYWQCTTGEEIDLSVQDEADTGTSQAREEVIR